LNPDLIKGTHNGSSILQNRKKYDEPVIEYDRKLIVDPVLNKFMAQSLR